MKAMVLAAGVGSRLDPLTSCLPKPLVPVANFPVMEHLLNLLKAHGFTDVIANLHYLPECLIEYFGDGKKFGTNIQFRVEEKLSGDAGGVRYCRDFLADGTFIVLMGDLLTDADLSHIVAEHKRKKAIATIGLKRVDDVSRFGVAVLDENGFIVGFQEKPSKEEALSNLASTGIYILEPEVFNYMPETGDYGFGRQLFPSLVKAGLPVLGVPIESYWSDVGTIEQYQSSNFDVLSGQFKANLPGYRQEQRGGYSLYLADGADIDKSVEIAGNVIVGKNAQIKSGVVLRGNVVIGAGSVIEAGCKLSDTIVWPDSTIESATILDGAIVSPAGLVQVGETGENRVITNPKKSGPANKTQVQSRILESVGACV
ncbi:MAG: NDP-sugar synthase [Candidatus Obscuribacterales bacterium]|jgi:mannose-1-phosphate guanylyltransferase/mannose-1-phosphate guanylyltransferase/phosphomannomutase